MHTCATRSHVWEIETFSSNFKLQHSRQRRSIHPCVHNRKTSIRVIIFVNKRSSNTLIRDARDPRLTSAHVTCETMQSQ